MKTALTLGSARFLMSALMALSISACTIEATDPDPSNDDEIAPAKAAASVNGTPLNVTSMKLQRGMWIPSSGGDSYTSNTVKLTASDGSSIDIRWDHEALGTFTTLESGYADSPGATYTSPGGKKYHSISGRIAITRYDQPTLDYITSGTFEFVGQVPFEKDTIRITNGSFSNVRN